MNYIPLSTNDQIAQMAQLAQDENENQRRQQMAQAFMSAGYVPNSGRGGVLAALLSGLTGGILQKNANEKATDILRRKFDMENQQAQAAYAQKVAEEDRKFQRELEAANAKAVAEAKAKRDYAAPEFTGGGVFDPATGKFTASPEWTQQQLAVERAKAAIAAGNRQDPNAGLLAKIQLAQQLGATPEQVRAMVTGQQGAPDTQIVGQNIVDKRTGKAVPITGPDGKPMEAPQAPLTADARNKLALIDNALANAKEYQKRVTAGQKAGGFNDVASQMGDTPQLMKSAIQDMLYAKSGASAPVEEVRKAEAMYGPGRLSLPLVGETPIPTEFDSTSSAKVANFISDMERMRALMLGQGGQQAPAAAAQPDQAAIIEELRRRGVNIGGPAGG